MLLLNSIVLCTSCLLVRASHVAHIVCSKLPDEQSMSSALRMGFVTSPASSQMTRRQINTAPAQDLTTST